MRELAHGILLQEQGRLEDAEACYQQVIARDPNNDVAFSRMAMCQLEMPGRRRDALKSIEQAIRLNPDEAHFHALKSLILGKLSRGKEALEVAGRAIAMDPENSFTAVVKAAAYCELRQWEQAEEWARRALALDADSIMAANLLTHVLMVQGKQEQNQFAVEQLLAAAPEDSHSHFNAGLSSLASGNHVKAEGHFREALRLDPEMEAAREGLLESFRARSWLYRCYLKYLFFMQRFTAGKQWAILIGAYIAYRITHGIVETFHKGLGYVVMIVWVVVILFSWLAPSLGNFFVLLDKSARHALKPQERWLGRVVAPGLLLGIVGSSAGFIGGWPFLVPPSLGAIAFTIPFSLAMDNESKVGRWLFGSVSVFILLTTLAATVLEAVSPSKELSSVSVLVVSVNLIGAFLCTWLGNIRALREAREA